MKSRGQVIVLLAVFIGTAVMAVLVFLSLSTLYAVRSHARASLQQAVNAGVRCGDYEEDGRAFLREDRARNLVREVFYRSLSLQTYGLGADPRDIADNMAVDVYNNAPWTGYTGYTHEDIGISARVDIPVRVFFFTVSVPVLVEMEAKNP